MKSSGILVPTLTSDFVRVNGVVCGGLIHISILNMAAI
jgi:hypothetical protein